MTANERILVERIELEAVGGVDHLTSRLLLRDKGIEAAVVAKNRDEIAALVVEHIRRHYTIREKRRSK